MAVVVVALVLLAGAGAAVFHRPLRAEARSWKAARLGEEAQEAAAKEDWGAAQRAALESIGQAETLSSLRILAKAARMRDDPRALDFATALFGHDKSTMEERLGVITFALDSGDVLRAQAMFGALPQGAVEGNLDLRYQLVRMLLAAGDHRRAMELASSAAVGQRWPEFDLLVAKHLARRQRTDMQREVVGRAARVMAHPDLEVALEGLRLTGTLPREWIPEPFCRATWARFQGRVVEMSAKDRLYLEDVLWRLNPMARELQVQAVVGSYREQHLAELCNWLLRVGELERVLALTDPGDHPDGLGLEIFDYRMTALGRLRRYGQMEADLKTTPPGIPTVELLGYRSMVAGWAGKEAESVMLWQQAMDAARAETDRNWFYQLAGIAGVPGGHERQMEALAMAVEHRHGVLPEARSLHPLFSWLYRQGDMDRLLRISFRLLQREPGNKILINNYHYLRALHGVPDPAAPQMMRQLVASDPENAAFRGTLALVLLRTGDAAEALATLEELKDGPGDWRPAEQAIHAAALAALERWEEAEDAASRIDWDSFPAAAEAKALQAMGKRERNDAAEQNATRRDANSPGSP